MNTTRILAAAAFAIAAATPAFAQEATPDGFAQFSGSLTRAEVVADLVQARQNGSLMAMTQGYIEPVSSTKSRAQVQRETRAAIDSGAVLSIDSRVPSLAQMAAQPAPRVMALAR